MKKQLVQSSKMVADWHQCIVSDCHVAAAADYRHFGSVAERLGNLPESSYRPLHNQGDFLNIGSNDLCSAD